MKKNFKWLTSQLTAITQIFKNDSVSEENNELNEEERMLLEYDEKFNLYNSKRESLIQIQNELIEQPEDIIDNQSKENLKEILRKRKNIAVEMSAIMKKEDFKTEKINIFKDPAFSEKLNKIDKIKISLLEIDFEIPEAYKNNPERIQQYLKDNQENMTLKFLADSIGHLEIIRYYLCLEDDIESLTKTNPYNFTYILNTIQTFVEQSINQTSKENEEADQLPTFDLHKEIEIFRSFTILQCFLENDIPNPEIDPLYGDIIYQIKEILIQTLIQQFLNSIKNNTFFDQSILIQDIPLIALNCIEKLISLSPPYFIQYDAIITIDCLCQIYRIHKDLKKLDHKIYDCFTSMIKYHYDFIDDQIYQQLSQIVINDLSIKSPDDSEYQSYSISFIRELAEIEEQLHFSISRHLIQRIMPRIVPKLFELINPTDDPSDDSTLSNKAEECIEQIARAEPQTMFSRILKDKYDSNKYDRSIENQNQALIAFKCILYTSNESFVSERLPDLIKIGKHFDQKLRATLFDILIFVADKYPEIIIQENCISDISALIKISKESDDLILLKCFNLINLILKNLYEALSKNIQLQFDAFNSFIRRELNSQDLEISNAAIDCLVTLINHSTKELHPSLIQLFKSYIQDIQDHKDGSYRQKSFNFSEDSNEMHLYICAIPSLNDLFNDQISSKEMLTLMKFVNYALDSDIESAIQASIRMIQSAHQHKISFSAFGEDLYGKLNTIHNTNDPAKMQLTSIALAKLCYYYPNDTSRYIQSIYNQFIQNLNNKKDETIHRAFPSIFQAISIILQIDELKSNHALEFIDQTKKQELADILNTLRKPLFNPEDQFYYYLQLIDAYLSFMNFVQSDKSFMNSFVKQKALLFLKQLEKSEFCHDDILVSSLKIIVILFNTFGQRIYSDMKHPLIKHIIEKGTEYPDEDISSISSKMLYLIQPK